jgi:hypothetical protein
MQVNPNQLIGMGVGQSNRLRFGISVVAGAVNHGEGQGRA